MDRLIQVRDLAKTYQMGLVAVPALRGVSFDIARGEFVAIMGPSGSGKSTLMNLLGCLDRPSSGSYCLEGLPVDQLTKDQLAAVRNRRIGFVFQTFNLLTRNTALENVELPMIYDGRLSRQERRARAAWALDAVGLLGRLGHRPREMSGGEQQRVAIARALAVFPAILLADEPTGNLDSHAGHEVMGIFSDLNSQGITIILVTHETDIARYARRLLTVRDGLLVSDVAQGGKGRQDDAGCESNRVDTDRHAEGP